MGELQISDLIKEGEIEELKELDNTIRRVKATYVDVAKELAKGLKMNVEVSGDLDKLNNIYVTQAKNATLASDELTAALKRQSEVSGEVAKRLEAQVKSGELSAAEMKKVAAAGAQNAATLEKMAKAEATLEKAQNSGLDARKKVTLTEEERLKLIRQALALTNKEVHSKAEATAMNKELRRAVDVLKDTDEGYILTLGRLNSTIGVNTDYIKRNSDRYTQQKMTIGAYREEIKAAIYELERGNSSMSRMGIIAQSTGKFLKSHMAPGLNQVHVSMKSMISGYVGAQAVVGGIVKLFTKLREGVGSVVEFEYANSRLAAILGTTSDKIKDMTADAQRLGATTRYTASEATNLQIELAKLGFSRKEILQSTEGILRFAQATGAELPEAAALAGASLRMFGADTKETDRYVSAMAVATTKSALSFSYLATALPIVGPVAKSFNFTIEDTLALLGKLADAGFDASMSATATRNILLNLADGSGKLAKALGKPVRTLPELVSGLQALKEKGVDLNTTLKLTDKRSVAAFNAFLTAADKIVPLRDQITGVEGELSDMAHTMEDNVKGAIAGLDSAWEALMLSFSSGTGPAKDFIDWVAKKIRQIAELLKDPEQRLGETESKLELDAQKEVQTKMEIQEIEYQKRVEQLKKQYRKKYLEEGKSEEIANAKAIEDAQVQAAKETLSTLQTLKKSQKEIEVWDERNLKYSRDYYKQTLKNWEDTTVLGLNWKNGLAKMFGFETKEIKNVNKAFLDFANLKMDISKTKAYGEAIDDLIGKMNQIINPVDTTNDTHELTDKEKRELEKAEREKQKIREAYQNSELALMDEGLEKELKRISLGYAKKIAALKGGGDGIKKAQDKIREEMQAALEKYTISYNTNREQKDIANALEVAKKGSKEELALKLSQLDLQRKAEMDAAVKTGEDVSLISDKYAKKKQDLLEEHASQQVLLIADNAAAEQKVRDQQYQTDMLGLKKQLAQKLITEKEYAEEEYRITVDYARKTAEAGIDALEMELKTDNLSTEDRAKIAEQLQKLKADLAKKEAEAEIKAIEDVDKAEEDSKKKRIKNLKKWLQTASDVIGAIGDLVGTVYDGKIEKIEKEQETNEEAYDREMDRTQQLAENKIITEEEAEARKRAAKDKTEARNEELERKKAALAHKQALWEKATSASQAGIATALGIMQVWATPGATFVQRMIQAAIVGAMGAFQVATILATPIPAYAEGTKNKEGHPGGAALVGDGGKHEVVTYAGQVWLTPDIPTLVDLPRGAQVFPDVESMDFPTFRNPTLAPSYISNADSFTRKAIVINDYAKLEKKMERTNQLLEASIKQQHRDAYNLEYKLYKASKLC